MPPLAMLFWCVVIGGLLQEHVYAWAAASALFFLYSCAVMIVDAIRQTKGAA